MCGKLAEDGRGILAGQRGWGLRTPRGNAAAYIPASPRRSPVRTDPYKPSLSRSPHTDLFRGALSRQAQECGADAEPSLTPTTLHRSTT